MCGHDVRSLEGNWDCLKVPLLNESFLPRLFNHIWLVFNRFDKVLMPEEPLMVLNTFQ